VRFVEMWRGIVAERAIRNWHRDGSVVANARAGTKSFSSSAMCRNFYLSVIYNLPLTKLDGAAAESAARRLKWRRRRARSDGARSVNYRVAPGSRRLNIERRARPGRAGPVATVVGVARRPSPRRAPSCGRWTTFAPAFISSSFPSVSSDYLDFSGVRTQAIRS